MCIVPRPLLHAGRNCRPGPAPARSSALQFQHSFEPGCFETSMILRMFGNLGRAAAVDLEADLDAVALAESGHLVERAGRSARASWPTGTPAGKPLGRTLTPEPPTSWHSLMKALVSSMFLFSTAGSARVILAQRCPARPAPPGCRQTAWPLPCAAASSSDGSTPCLCVVRSSTPRKPVFSQLPISVGRSQSAPHCK